MTKYSSYILYLLISILVVILYVNGIGPLDSLQQSVNDALRRITAAEGPRPNIAIVEIDGRALDEYGSWPWNRDLIADLAAAGRLDEDGPAELAPFLIRQRRARVRVFGDALEMTLSVLSGTMFRPGEVPKQEGDAR